jgi:hypothetical protein
MNLAFIKSRRLWVFSGILALVAGLGLYCLAPHYRSILAADTTLQGGQKMSVKFTVQSPYGWQAPTKLVGMEVKIDQRVLWLDEKGYYGLDPINVNIKPVITERRGFPEITLQGSAGSDLKVIHWRFLNFSFSELSVQRAGEPQVSYFAEPPLPPVERPLPHQEQAAIYLDSNENRPIPSKPVSR